ncbi:MAG TPA: DUF2585 family protein [Tepidisphaeraceae bacterium]
MPKDADRRGVWGSLLIIAGIMLLTAVIELAMGRLLISKSGHVRLWAATNTSELSQQIADAYSFSHLIHGFLFYAVLWMIFRRRLPWINRLILAVIVEAAWEVIENSPFLINRYRTATISLDYYGDSILNSMFDILFAILGFVLAARLPVWVTIATTIAIEVTLALTIRDNLALNIIMLLHPFPAIKHWQTSA